MEDYQGNQNTMKYYHRLKALHASIHITQGETIIYLDLVSVANTFIGSE